MAANARRIHGSTTLSARLGAIYLAVLSLFGVSLLNAPATAADTQRGLELAKAWCNACHSIGDDEPRQEDAGPLFTELAKKDSSYLQTAINRPHDFMPDFPQLTEADKADLIAYIRSLAGG